MASRLVSQFRRIVLGTKLYGTELSWLMGEFCDMHPPSATRTSLKETIQMLNYLHTTSVLDNLAVVQNKTYQQTASSIPLGALSHITLTLNCRV